MSVEHVIEIISVDDETEELWVDGKCKMSTSHDEHGWNGMRIMRETAKSIAEEVGAVFKGDV